MWTAGLAIANGAASASWKWLTKGGGWKIVAAALTVATAAYFIISYRSRGNQIESLTADLSVARGEVALARSARATDNAVLVQRAEARTVILSTEVINRARTDAAIAANPSWANQPIPDGVVASLRE